MALLTSLGTQLVQAKLDEAELRSKLWWLKWRDVATEVLQAIRDVAGRSTIIIRTGVLNITIRGSKAAPEKKPSAKKRKAARQVK